MAAKHKVLDLAAHVKQVKEAKGFLDITNIDVDGKGARVTSMVPGSGTLMSQDPTHPFSNVFYRVNGGYKAQERFLAALGHGKGGVVSQ